MCNPEYIQFSTLFHEFNDVGYDEEEVFVLMNDIVKESIRRDIKRHLVLCYYKF